MTEKDEHAVEHVPVEGFPTEHGPVQHGPVERGPIERGLRGRTAVVTGASRGIGLEIAARLVREGVRVCITGRKPDPLKDAVEALGGSDQVLAVAGNMGDSAHHRDIVAQTIDRFGSLDFLVNNAGINPVHGPLMQLDMAAAQKIFTVNDLGTLSLIQHTFHSWMGDNGGAIVNIASVAGIRPAPGIAFYGASKAMLMHLTRDLAVELGPNIRVNAIAPAVVKTRFATALYEGREEELSARYPLRRLGLPSDIADVATFLLSQEAGWMTGQTLVVDGGVTLAGTA